MFTRRMTFPKVLYVLFLAVSLLLYTPMNVLAEPSAIFNGSLQQAILRPCHQAAILMNAPTLKASGDGLKDACDVKLHALPPAQPHTYPQLAGYYTHQVCHVFFADTAHFAFRSIRCPPIA